MMQFQSQDETGYLEIETGRSLFFRDREGRERYFEWEELDGEVQDFLSKFVEDASLPLGPAGKEKGTKLNALIPLLFFMVRPAGFEPATYGFVDRDSELSNLLNFQ